MRNESYTIPSARQRASKHARTRQSAHAVAHAHAHAHALAVAAVRAQGRPSVREANGVKDAAITPRLGPDSLVHHVATRTRRCTIGTLEYPCGLILVFGCIRSSANHLYIAMEFGNVGILWQVATLAHRYISTRHRISIQRCPNYEMCTVQGGV